jgi:hypothetical protein
MSSFVELGVGPELVALLEASGITKPTPVQSATIPQLLKHRDVAVEVSSSFVSRCFFMILIAELPLNKDNI